VYRGIIFIEDVEDLPNSLERAFVELRLIGLIMAPGKKAMSSVRRFSTLSPTQSSPTEIAAPSQPQDLPPKNSDALGDASFLYSLMAQFLMCNICSLYRCCCMCEENLQEMSREVLGKRK
ncbi:hypothetical protein C3L33_12614, partial [Rhododendron williamsianum]